MKASNTVERGNTQKGVNTAVYNYLDQQEFASLLDIPCGQGEFLRHIRSHRPKVKLAGIDLFATPHPEIQDVFIRGDAREGFRSLGNQKFDVITSISGVMCFDNVSGFFKNCSGHLNQNGVLIITNDNIQTIRDRLSFLFLGRLKRFKLLYSANEGNWNVVLIQGLWKQFKLNGFKIEKVEYVSLYLEDIVFAPLALMIYPIWLLNLLFTKAEMPIKERLALFSIKALIYRHYIIYGRKT